MALVRVLMILMDVLRVITGVHLILLLLILLILPVVIPREVLTLVVLLHTPLTLLLVNVMALELRLARPA